jgi:hypothetical protein
MAFNFPSNPQDGQLYPDPPVPGAQQYIYNGAKEVWLTTARGVQQLFAELPVFLTGTDEAPIININPATPLEGGYMTAADKDKLDKVKIANGTVEEITAGVGLGAPNTGEKITVTGTLDLLPPTPVSIGGVKEGDNTVIAADGRITVKAPTSLINGAVRQGKGITISADGIASIAVGGTYTVLDSLASRFNGSSVTFPLTVAGVPFAPASPNSLLIFIGGVIQIPNVSFSLNGSNITFGSPPPTGASFYGVSLT